MGRLRDGLGWLGSGVGFVWSLGGLRGREKNKGGGENVDGASSMGSESQPEASAERARPTNARWKEDRFYEGVVSGQNNGRVRIGFQGLEQKQQYLFFVDPIKGKLTGIEEGRYRLGWIKLTSRGYDRGMESGMIRVVEGTKVAITRGYLKGIVRGNLDEMYGPNCGKEKTMGGVLEPEVYGLGDSVFAESDGELFDVDAAIEGMPKPHDTSALTMPAGELLGEDVDQQDNEK